MSDKEVKNEKSNAGQGWTDKERLTYLFALIEHSNVKFDYNNTPRPADRTAIACKFMISRLKATLKHELAALKNGNPISASSSSKATTAASRKRKAKGDGNAGAAPAKRGRKKKAVTPEMETNEDGDADGDTDVKTESKDESLGSDDEV